jgi:hypothetical protein
MRARAGSDSTISHSIPHIFAQFCPYYFVKEDCYADVRERGTALLLVRYQIVGFCMASRPVHANVAVFSFNVVYRHPYMPTRTVSCRLIRIAVVVENEVVHVAL